MNSAQKALKAFTAGVADSEEFEYVVIDEETLKEETLTATGKDLRAAIEVLVRYGFIEPEPQNYGAWVNGIPVIVGSWVENGEYPFDKNALKEIIEGVCYKNAKKYFRLEDK